MYNWTRLKHFLSLKLRTRLFCTKNFVNYFWEIKIQLPPFTTVATCHNTNIFSSFNFELIGFSTKTFVPKFWKFVPNPKITSIDSNSAFTTVATCHNTNIFSSFKFELNWILYKKILYQTFMCWVVHLQNYTGLAVFVPPGYNYLYPTHLYQSTQYLETNLLLPLKLVQIFHH